MRYWIFSFLVFLGGFNLALNLVELLPNNNEWEGEWWKAILSFILAIVFSFMAKDSADD